VKLKRPIDLHKGLTALVVVALMVAADNFTLGPWVYLALHGSYGLMWVAKSRLFPDPAWEREVPLWQAAGTFAALLLYWVAPAVLIFTRYAPPAWLVCLAVTLNLLGVFLHFASDAQKYFTLKARPGLITTGLFARTRNPNYLGEMLIYGAFALLAGHWAPWLVLALFWGAIFLPNMLRKDRSLSRHPGWEAYRGQSGLLLPRLF